MSNLFLPWKYEEEEAGINRRSAEGYHLVKRTLLSKKEKQDSARVYRYLLDCKSRNGLTELLYQKQGWELICRRGAWLYYRKEYREGTPEAEYVLYRPEKQENSIEVHLRSVVKTLDTIRNILLIITAVLLLVMGFVETQLVRLFALPLIICIPLAIFSGKIRKALGEPNAAR